MRVLALLVAFCFAAAPAYAALDYTPDGRVIQSGAYDGPALTLHDARWLLGDAGSYGLFHAVHVELAHVGFGGVLPALVPTALVMACGAQRTTLYRPIEIAQGIRERLAMRAGTPVMGTAAEVLALR